MQRALWLPSVLTSAACPQQERKSRHERTVLSSSATEKRIRERLKQYRDWKLLKTLPGVGDILGATLYLEIGDVERFPTPAYLASYAGLTPTVHASGGKTRLGPTSKRSNHYLRWAFVEAANCIVMQQKKLREQHVVRLYQRLKASKGHSRAAVAVGRHLGEASWWMLKKNQPYQAPRQRVQTSSEIG